MHSLRNTLRVPLRISCTEKYWWKNVSRVKAAKAAKVFSQVHLLQALRLGNRGMKSLFHKPLQTSRSGFVALAINLESKKKMKSLDWCWTPREGLGSATGKKVWNRRKDERDSRLTCLLKWLRCAKRTPTSHYMIARWYTKRTRVQKGLDFHALYDVT